MSTKYLIEDRTSGFRLDKHIQAEFKIPFGVVSTMLRKKKIKLNNKVVTIGSVKLSLGDEVEIFENIQKQENPNIAKKHIPEQIINELTKSIILNDTDIIAINKPYGLAVQGGTGLKYSIDDCFDNKALLETLKLDQKPKIVHRLDINTTGVLIFAKNKIAASKLSEIFASRNITKTYTAVVQGKLSQNQGTIEAGISKQSFKSYSSYNLDEGSKHSLTKYNVVKTFKNDIHLINVEILTGRYHQIRSHLNLIGLSIIGDFKYGYRGDNKQQQILLHSSSLCFSLDGNSYKIEADLPERFNLFLLNV